MDFLQKFKPGLLVESPGRVNIIGEDTDYNLGYVLPTAIAISLASNFRRTNRIRIVMYTVPTTKKDLKFN